MSHSEYTENYKLARFVDTDQPTFLGDWNETMDDIDGAIKGVADKETTLGNTVSALILRVDDHDGRIETLEGDTASLKSTVETHAKSISTLTTKTDELQAEFDSIESATSTTAGLVKISDSTSGSATDTALSQKGARAIVAGIENGDYSNIQTLTSESVTFGDNFTAGSVHVEILADNSNRQLVIRTYNTEPLTSNGAGSSVQTLAYTLDSQYRSTHGYRVLLDAYPTRTGTVTLAAQIVPEGIITIRATSEGTCSEVSLSGEGTSFYRGL